MNEPVAVRDVLGKTVDEIIAGQAGQIPARLRDDVDVESAKRAAYADQWAARIPPRFQNAYLSDLVNNVDERDARPYTETDLVATELDAWADRRGRENVVILGPVGVGKTHAAVGVARLRHFQGEPVRFWPVVELLDALRPGGDEDAAETARTTAVLVLDDLGAERPTDWTAERLYALVNRRWLDMVPTIVTSNLPVPELRAAVGDRLYSRLAHDALAVRLGGEDRRRA